MTWWPIAIATLLKGLEFNSLDPHDRPQPSVARIPGDLSLSFGLLRNTDRQCRQNTYKQIIEHNRKCRINFKCKVARLGLVDESVIKPLPCKLKEQLQPVEPS